MGSNYIRGDSVVVSSESDVIDSGNLANVIDVSCKENVVQIEL